MQIQLENLLSQLGNPGRYQKVIFLLLALNYLPVVFNHVIMAFFGATPKHQCYSESYESMLDSHQMTNGNLSDNSSMTTDQSIIVDKRLKECRAEYLFKSGQNVSVVCGVGGTGKSKYYKEPRETTIVTEFNLVCDIKYLSSLATTIYFCGVMLGGILFGHVADKFGRRPVMLLTLYMPIFVGVGISFAPWYSLFAALRFIQGVLMQGLQTSTYTMAMELFLPKYRSHAGVLFECFWGFGVVLLPALAYLIQDWRYLQLATCLPSLLAFGYICIMPESLRWLIMMGKVDKAEALITKIAEKNKLPYPHENWKDVKLQLETRDTNNKQYSFIDLVRTPVLRKRSLILFYIWFATSIGYYGLTWKLTELAGNKYLNFFIGGAVEFVAYVLVLPVTKRFGRRRPLCFYFLLAAATCITAGGLMFQPNRILEWEAVPSGPVLEVSLPPRSF
ncbi:hypothetical protein CHS0354_041492 [Potamilus streckersoni]|uniref:Major facilitator superfamily (MFS) profile domain-containing protein n=1 Tax=Potamilus streckersoni TaxID=2493646 RepID=A0AAE0TB62_9BIVA|nr:hypothetical protein CHS0354_041492 [Potamilus streckersoni]